ncbi:MAG TPA: helix-turn-helix domain-containing protein [Nocardioides sp.]|uniref:PucR family transcriptional regulator n=1 Tax=Nocardioides sp. TaxID=35761 RepID=UPI002E3527E8|nr:helix-turn-helix domain-containing protein [Nocardioides sp.]HEX5088922.1 helix-turn-helix domain-containing protein [Nocardioides sp.]
MSARGADPHSRVAEQLRRSTGVLSTAATTRMAEELPWFRELSAEDRSWVGMILQAGVRGFVDWFEESGDSPTIATSVFGAAPRALAGVITLQQTVDLVRLSIEVVESNIEDLLQPEDVDDVRRAVSRYAREVAFATAEVYARAAEVRGAWDARLEALVVDAVLRAETDEAVLSRASALGWKARGTVCVVLGASPERRTETDLFDEVRRTAGAGGMDALCAVQGDRLVVLLGGVADPRQAAAVIADLFGDGPVVAGPVAADLATAAVSARAAVSAYRSAPGWPDAPRPVLAGELLAERALGGDGHARRQLVDDVYLPLLHARGALIETLSAWLDRGSSIEGAARALFVHPNTVRYRLRQVADLTGLTPSQPRDAFTLQIALVLGRQSGRASEPAPATGNVDIASDTA